VCKQLNDQDVLDTNVKACFPKEVKTRPGSRSGAQEVPIRLVLPRFCSLNPMSCFAAPQDCC
jgi:hypothetical protein